jgi:hypothetical protein
MFKASILLLCLLALGCSSARVIGTIPLPENSQLIYVGASVSKPFSGNSLTVIDRLLYDDKTKQCTLVRSDSTSSNSNLLNKIKQLEVPLLP